MANKERDFGQKQQGQQGQQQGMQDDRSDREAGKPLQLDNEKMNEKQGGDKAGQHQQGGQPQQGQRPQGGQQQANR